MKYAANPVVVDAFKIVEIFEPNHTLPLRLDDNSIVEAMQEMTARFMPKVGDYWVIQSDGYTYLNPAEVFELKYSPMKEEN